MVDNLNRVLQGQPAVDQHIPIKMFAKENIGDVSDQEAKIGWQGDYDFRSKYRTLWGLK